MNNARCCVSREIIVCCVEGFSHFLVGSCAVLGSDLPDGRHRFEQSLLFPGDLWCSPLKGCFLYSSSTEEGEAESAKNISWDCRFWSIEHPGNQKEASVGLREKGGKTIDPSCHFEPWKKLYLSDKSTNTYFKYQKPIVLTFNFQIISL